MTASSAIPPTHELQVCVPAFKYASLGYLVGYSITASFSFGEAPGALAIKGKWASHTLSSDLEGLKLELKYAKGQPTTVLIASQRAGEIAEVRKRNRQNFTYFIGSSLGGASVYNVQLVVQALPILVVGETPAERWPALVIFLDRLQATVRSSVLSS